MKESNFTVIRAAASHRWTKGILSLIHQLTRINKSTEIIVIANLMQKNMNCMAERLTKKQPLNHMRNTLHKSTTSSVRDQTRLPMNRTLTARSRQETVNLTILDLLNKIHWPIKMLLILKWTRVASSKLRTKTKIYQVYKIFINCNKFSNFKSFKRT